VSCGKAGTGAVTDTYDYDGFGNLIGSAGTTPNVYRYQGEALDAETGLYCLRARYYDPVAGRFLTVDPLADEGQHPYEYAGADPVNGHDPTGQQDIIEYTLLLKVLQPPMPPDVIFGCLGSAEFAPPMTFVLEWLGSCQQAGGGAGGGPGAGSNPPSDPKEPSCCDQAKQIPRNLPVLAPILQKRTGARLLSPFSGIFNSAMEDAYNKLTTSETCCKFFGPGAVNALQSARWSFRAEGWPRVNSSGEPTSEGAETLPGAVFINSQGPFIDPGRTWVLANGGLKQEDMSGGLGDVGARAMIILHELGHLTGKFLQDTGKFAYRNPEYSNEVRKACFQ
jgi:RHS repeat-associated protein